MDSIVLETNLGDIQLELYWDHAPKVSLHGLVVRDTTPGILDLTLPSSTDVQELCRAHQKRILQ